MEINIHSSLLLVPQGNRIHPNKKRTLNVTVRNEKIDQVSSNKLKQQAVSKNRASKETANILIDDSSYR
jgi:hypothetical protein